MDRLNSLCDIQLGYTARGRLELADSGVRAIQLRDTAPEGGIAADHVGRYELDTIPDRYWAKPGDVLFRSRGERNTAAPLPASFEPAVAVMPLVILRPHSSRVGADYLAWFINQPPTQRYFDSCARGTNMRMIPVGCLANLEVPVPTQPTQRMIAEIDSLARREFALTQQLAEKRKQMTTLALLEKAQQLPTHPTKEGRK